MSMMLCSPGRNVAAAKAAAMADHAPGNHHAWRYKMGRRRVLMAEIVR
ncbi:hypothetical protein QTH90_30905 [Variovorax sp. J2P1-59]|nr:hypothetical protein [Variovorax sp. J2P1-59]MDM0078851.1 hypothetical protein [Variovorax sp. J2P1-59]